MPFPKQMGKYLTSNDFVVGHPNWTFSLLSHLLYASAYTFMNSGLTCLRLC